MRGYWQVFVTSFRESQANPLRLLGSVVLGVFRMVLFAAIYKVAYDSISGSSLPYANAVWSVGLYFAFIIGLGVRTVFQLVERDVKTGAVEQSLIRPLDWRMTKVCYQLGRNISDFVAMCVAFAIALTLLVGIPDLSYVTPGFVAGYLLLFVMTIICAGALYLTVGITAFWLNDAMSVNRILDKFILIFGGAFVPIALLPDVVQSIVRFSPFGVFAASTQLFNPGLVATLVPTILAAIFWTIVIVLFCNWVWRRRPSKG